MGSFLIASYSLKLRKIYNDIKDRIPGILVGNFIDNRKKILKFVLPLVRESYRTGIQFAAVYCNQRGKKIPEPSFRISDKTREILLKRFLLLVRNAEDVCKLKKELRSRTLDQVETRKGTKKGSDINMIEKEYINSVKRAVNSLILDSGERGQLLIFKDIER